MEQSGQLHVSVTVTNTGKVFGREVVQLYIRDLVGSVIRPVRELKAFEKIDLEPSQSKEVIFVITNEMLKFYGADMRFDSEAGSFKVFVGGDSTTQNEIEFELV